MDCTVSGRPTACPELAPSTDTTAVASVLVCQDVHNAQAELLISSDALRERFPDGHGSMSAVHITHKQGHALSRHIAVVLQGELNALQDLREFWLPHNALEQSRVAAGVHALREGKFRRQQSTAVSILAAIHITKCRHQSLHRVFQQLLVPPASVVHLLQVIPAKESSPNTEQYTEQ